MHLSDCTHSDCTHHAWSAASCPRPWASVRHMLPHLHAVPSCPICCILGLCREASRAPCRRPGWAGSRCSGTGCRRARAPAAPAPAQCPLHAPWSAPRGRPPPCRACRSRTGCHGTPRCALRMHESLWISMHASEIHRLPMSVLHSAVKAAACTMMRRASMTQSLGRCMHGNERGSVPCTGLKPRVQSPRPSAVTTEQPSRDATGARQALMHLVVTASARGR